MGCTLFNFTDDNKWRISVLGFQPACIRSTRWRPIAESKQSAASLCMRRCQGIQHLIYKILRECKIKIWPIIDAMTRFIESMMGYIEKGRAVPWCQGTVVASFWGVFVRRFHTGWPIMSGPINCSTTFRSLSFDHTSLKAFKAQINRAVYTMSSIA